MAAFAWGFVSVMCFATLIQFLLVFISRRLVGEFVDPSPPRTVTPCSVGLRSALLITIMLRYCHEVFVVAVFVAVAVVELFAQCGKGTCEA